MDSIKLLAIDASTDLCSASLYIDGKIFNRQQLLPRSHAKLLLPMIESLLTETGLTLQDLTGLACSPGPGSFTGVRIACSMVQALGFGLNIPIVLVSSLHAMAEGAYRKQKLEQICVTLEAGQQEVYWAFFKQGNQQKMQSISEIKVGVKELIEFPIGNWDCYSENPEAQDIAEIAAFNFKSGNSIPAHKVEPIYLKSEFVKKMTT